MKKRVKKANIFFTLYIILMIWLLFGQRLTTLSFDGYTERLAQNINFVPFLTIKNYLWVIIHAPGINTARVAIINLAGNIVMFIPLGFFLPLVRPKLKNFFRLLLTAVFIIVSVEIIQLFTLLGSCDIDDLIFNIIGVLIGYILYLSASLLKKHKK